MKHRTSNSRTKTRGRARAKEGVEHPTGPGKFSRTTDLNVEGRHNRGKKLKTIYGENIGRMGRRCKVNKGHPRFVHGSRDEEGISCTPNQDENQARRSKMEGSDGTPIQDEPRRDQGIE